jgi:uncharacterized membrane protein YfcA
VSPTTIALLAFAAFAAGLIDAIGGGGGLVTLPALLAAGLPPAQAIATNKGQAVFGAISSFVSFALRGVIEWRRAALGFGAGFLGSLLGAWVVLRIDSKPLRPIVIVLLLVAAGFLAWPRKPSKGTAHSWALVALVPTTFGLGFYDGFFGPGVGSMLIVAFVLLFGDTLVRASGNAKAVNLASNVAALLLFLWHDLTTPMGPRTILWEVSLPMAVANALGAFLGSRIAVRGGDKVVRIVVLVVVAVVVVKLAVDLLR